MSEVAPRTPQSPDDGMTAATEFRQIRLSRETRDWLAAGAVLLRELAGDFKADLSLAELEKLDQCAYACETLVDEWDAAAGEGPSAPQTL